MITQTTLLTVQASNPISYNIHIGQNAIRSVANHLKNSSGQSSVFLVTDHHIFSLHGEWLRLNMPDVDLQVIEVQQGEQAKSIETALYIIDRLRELKARRRSIVIAFGGGSIIDLTGFVAAIYMRGIDYINIPTTLLAQIDAAVGGKVAVNHPLAKNFIGAFYHPVAVISDPQVLASLDTAEISNGLAEAIKVAMIASPELFEFIEKEKEAILSLDTSALVSLIEQSVRLKINLLDLDPYENDLHRTLDFGHSIAHTIEASRQFHGIKHGEAVALGMVAATRIGCERGLCSPDVLHRLLQLLASVNLPMSLSQQPADDWSAYWDSIRLIRNGNLNLVVPIEIGETLFLEDVPNAELLQALTDHDTLR